MLTPQTLPRVTTRPRLGARGADRRAGARRGSCTSDARYRDSGRALLRDLHVSSPMLRRSPATRCRRPTGVHHARTRCSQPRRSVTRRWSTRARAAFDVLLQRSYARGWGCATRLAVGNRQERHHPACCRIRCRWHPRSLAAHQLTGDRRYSSRSRSISPAILEQRLRRSPGGYHDAVEGSGRRGQPESPTVAGDRTKHVFDDVLPGANAAAAALSSPTWRL